MLIGTQIISCYRILTKSASMPEVTGSFLYRLPVGSTGSSYFECQKAESAHPKSQCCACTAAGLIKPGSDVERIIIQQKGEGSGSQEQRVQRFKWIKNKPQRYQEQQFDFQIMDGAIKDLLLCEYVGSKITYFHLSLVV